MNITVIDSKLRRTRFKTKKDTLVSIWNAFEIANRPIEFFEYPVFNLGNSLMADKSAHGWIPLTPDFSIANAMISVA